MKFITMKPNQFLLMAGLGLATLTFSSCEKEQVLPATPGKPTTGTPTTTTPPPVTTPPVTTNSLVKQFDTDVFKYDARNRVVEVSYTYQADLGYAVVYEGSKVARLNYKNGDYALYTYEGDKVVKAVVHAPDNKVKFDYTLAYTGDRVVKLTTITFVDIPSKRGHLSIIDYKYDTKGNLAEQVLVWSPSNSPDDMRGPTVIKWGDYDNNPNPMPFTLHNLYIPGVKVSTNNPGFRDLYGKELYAYTYHDSGMPKERTLRLEREPGLQPYTVKYTY
ncbi:hypothetical protein ACFSRY_01730 [Pontibacter locisalis]|uniref:YD repeat-containing protein n=1 Tax=Pontibacter locisalis TaxID=1719035 RepID=A0ABW5IH27_9BACT